MDFSNVWAYAFSYKARDFLYDRKWEGRVVEGSSDVILMGRVEKYGDVIEVVDSKVFEIDDFKLLWRFHNGCNKDLVRDFYLECNPDLFKNRRFRLEDVFGKVCFDEGVEEIMI